MGEIAPKADPLSPEFTRAAKSALSSVVGPLMPLRKAATYEVQVVALYRQRASWHFAIGRSTMVRVKL
jgi:hypothetical protein